MDGAVQFLRPRGDCASLTGGFFGLTHQVASQAGEFGGRTCYRLGPLSHLIDQRSQVDTHPIQREFFDFYRTARGAFTPAGSSSELTTHPTLTSNIKFMNFYPFSDIETISPRPMLFIAGENAHSREFSEEAFRLAGEPKELFIVPNAGHVDLYDRVNLIPFDKLTQFFKNSLK